MKYLFKEILASFRENKMRVTDQRKQLLEIILQNPDLSPKEILYIAHKKDSSIGRATVYRMVHSLQELGYIRRQYVKIIPKGRSADSQIAVSRSP
ncbi:transcriptional repressor [Treponema sp. Marseille-Q4523]|uniref:transcriptional repressor n=1 Tax=Treponema TaxID=157 RepID=UPI00196159B2|nr:transcriptional repressor [Treponema sp. Marseille-Q4523]MBM7022979.1 transcriptional repressor [Treponema sp. Marseille-Q4523]